MNSASRQQIVDEPPPRRKRWGADELARLSEMVEQSSLFYWKGRQTAALIEAFQRLYPLRYCFPCSSGTAALHIAIAALRLKPGDEVIVPPLTDMGSVIGILYQQAVPVFVDVDPGTYNLDPAAVRRAITPKTRAIMAVHLAGNPCDLAGLLALAREHNLVLIEDCAQAWGARYRGRAVGTIGDFGCFSFNDFKHISCGDGGIVATNVERYGPALGKWGDKSYDRVAGENDPALLRDPSDLAPNYRISEPQSAVAAAQLIKLPGMVDRRVKAGERLTAWLRDLAGVSTPGRHADDVHSYWFYLFRIDLDRCSVDRDTFTEALRAEGVPARPGYIPKLVYHYRVFQNHNFFGGTWPARDLGLTMMDYREVHCPVAEKIVEDAVFLPLSETMSDDYLDKIARAIRVIASRYIR